MNKWTRPFEWSGAIAGPARGPRAAPAHHYFAFLSYSHEDSAEADWLHEELEQFRVPASLAGKLTANGVVPKRLTPIFRDRQELAAGQDLTEEIRLALAASRCLIVLCSPAAAKSRWTNKEIEAFKRLHPEGCTIAAVIGGEPLAGNIPGREHEECFPPALLAKYDRRGRPTGKKSEPLAADLRQGKGGRRIGFLKIVAGILGVGLDELVQREQLRRQRRLAAISGGSIAGMLVAAGLAVTALQARDAARDQRREAEGLVEFMLGDLQNKLQPVGRLDVLDGLGARVLDYYRKQDTSELSDQGLAQRSKALTLMGQIARDRGDLDRAEALYHAAYAGTEESIRRDGNDPERLFEHAQNAFYIADIAFRRGRLDDAETRFREYRELADRMVALDPDNMRYRTEVQYAAANLGAILYSRRDFRGAVEQFKRALTTIRAFAAADPTNEEYENGLTNTLALLADAEEGDGRLGEAIETRRQHIALLEKLVARNGADAQFRLVPAHRDLGRLYSLTGNRDLAVDQLRAAVADGDKLLSLEPRNAKWLESTLSARLALARELFDKGGSSPAADVEATCARYRQLLAQDPSIALRRAGFRDCLILRSRVAAQAGQGAAAASFAAQAVDVAKSVKTTDPVADKFGAAAALRTLGEMRARSGDAPGARSAWNQAAALIPTGVAEKPLEIREHAVLLERLGRNDEAAELNRRLAQIGFRVATNERRTG